MFALCDKIISKNILKPNRKIFSNYNFSCFDDINNVPQTEWDKAVDGKNIFLSYSYLKTIDAQKNENFRFKYVIVYNRNSAIGVVYFQINDFSASLFGDLVSSQIEELKGKRTSIFKKYIEHNEDETIMRLVTCGNNFISGEHGFYLDVNNRKIKFKIIENVIDCVARAEKLRGKISAILVKDFYEDGFGDKDCWYCTRFKHFNVEPNMIIELPKNTSSLDEYLATFSKKYRQRARNIFKASALLQKKRLSVAEIIDNKNTLHTLYSQVFDHAKFKLAHLNDNYFADVAATHTQNFYVDAWFLNDKMISFASGFILNNEIEAHYIGFDYAINKEYELYQTLLYSYIEEAIHLNKHKINLGRTASEIKTTVGAKPYELLCYIKPQNTVSKLIMKPFMQFLQPSEWIPRNPFKED